MCVFAFCLLFKATAHASSSHTRSSTAHWSPVTCVSLFFSTACLRLKQTHSFGLHPFLRSPPSRHVAARRLAARQVLPRRGVKRLLLVCGALASVRGCGARQQPPTPFPLSLQTRPRPSWAPSSSRPSDSSASSRTSWCPTPRSSECCALRRRDRAFAFWRPRGAMLSLSPLLEQSL